jgi:nickel/cobalt transporter (NicO) family protein
MKPLRRFALLTAVAVCFLLALPGTASAHPMGNFSINRFAAIQIASGPVRVLYIVDMAEIPTFQELSNLGADPSGQLTAAQRSSYLPRQARSLAAGLNIHFAGRAVALRLRADDLIFPPGAGGLPTERLYFVFESRLSRVPGTLSYQDNNFAGRAGWKEIITPGGGSRTLSSTPSISRSRDLTEYPTSTSNSPPQDLNATVQILRGDRSTLVFSPANATIREAEAPLFGPDGRWSALAKGLTLKGTYASLSPGRTDALTTLIKNGDFSVGVLLLSLVVAFWFGAGHALSPGHGKTVVAAYLVGSRGTSAHAVLLGLTVTLTHTAGVFALGLVTIYLSRYILPDQLYPWLGFTSGMMVALMGLYLFARRLRAMRASHASTPFGTASPGHDQQDHHHTHAIDHHSHDHSHHHESVHGTEQHSDHEHIQTLGAGRVHRHGLFGRAHSHGPVPGQDGGKVSLKSLIALGVSGGILPCPSALIVLLSAIAFHRVAFGMLLIVAFSCGLATVLTAIGLLMVHSRRLIDRLQSRRTASLTTFLRVMPVLPVLSAASVAGIGAVLAIGALGPGMVPLLLTQL